MIIRRADPADAPQLTRLRAVMLDSMGIDAGPADAPWRKASDDWFHERLTTARYFAAFVADDAEHGVVACAVGSCDEHAPGPRVITGLRGYISNVVTDQHRRGQGHAGACFDALLTWFRDETPVRAVGLHATDDGANLYLRRDFTPPTYPELVLGLTRP